VRNVRRRLRARGVFGQIIFPMLERKMSGGNETFTNEIYFVR
jgi:hypothetical protein